MNTQNSQNDSNNSSLSMFFAAIGGAVLGMLATLLVLALINGGTLNFRASEFDLQQSQQIVETKQDLLNLTKKVDAVDANLGAVSSNCDSIAKQVEVLWTK